MNIPVLLMSVIGVVATSYGAIGLVGEASASVVDEDMLIPLGAALGGASTVFGIAWFLSSAWQKMKNGDCNRDKRIADQNKRIGDLERIIRERT